MTWLWWAIPLVLIVFLWTLNELLRGSLKETISGILALIIFMLVGVAFFVSGWEAAVGALIGAFILGNLLRPLAIPLARRLITYPEFDSDDCSHRQLERTTADFGTEAWLKHHEQEDEDEASHKAEVISDAMKLSAITEVLAQFGCTEQDIAALYDRIEVSSQPPRIRKIVLENARLVAFFLENSEPYDVYDGTYGRKLSMDTHIRLELWICNNPSGDEPQP